MPAAAVAQPATSSAARDRILRAAHDLFYRDGVRATGIDRVIAESGVAKLTFYRHFPSKNDLVLAYLDFRHDAWMAWFDDALRRHGGNVAALVPALAEWFQDEAYRGCAFLNSVGELADALPEVKEVTRRHKTDMARTIETLLPRGAATTAAGRRRRLLANDLATVIDGAIIRAQYDADPKAALASLKRITRTLIAPAA